MEGIDMNQMLSSKAMVPNIFGIRDQFWGRQFSTDQRWGVWFRDDSSAFHLLSTFFLLNHTQWELLGSGFFCSRLKVVGSKLGLGSDSGNLMK